MIRNMPIDQLEKVRGGCWCPGCSACLVGAIAVPVRSLSRARLFVAVVLLLQQQCIFLSCGYFNFHSVLSPIHLDKYI